MRPLKLDATFSEPLRRYQLQQEDIVQGVSALPFVLSTANC
jgi:hypothetical protein